VYYIGVCLKVSSNHASKFFRPTNHRSLLSLILFYLCRIMAKHSGSKPMESVS